MQRFFPLLLLAFCAGCTKMNYEYVVVCDYPRFFDEGTSWLVVSNDAGSILKIFDLSNQSAHLQERFDYAAADASDTYNLHFVHDGKGNYSSGVSKILSFYGLRNGAAADFITPYSGITFKSARIFFSDIGTADFVTVPGITQYAWTNGGPVLILSVDYLAESDLMIQIHPLGASTASCYVPTAALNPSDSIFLQRSDFLPAGQSLTLHAGSTSISSLEVSAIQPDLKRYVTFFEGVPAAPSGAIVPLPAGLPASGPFRVRMRQGDFTTEKIFLPGEDLRLDGPQISIDAALFSPYHSLQIATGGNPDLVEATSNALGLDPVNPYFHWTIKGPPEAFKQMQLPDLSSLLPELRTPMPEVNHWQVTAYRYDHLDYNQLLDGFPAKGSDGRAFPVARYGLQTVTRNF